MKESKEVVIRSRFTPRVRVTLVCEGKGRTKQSMKDECDINRVMKRFAATGVLPTASGKRPMYADVTGVDFQKMMDVMSSAQAAFDALPSGVRKRFSNDPGEFVDFASDPDNAEELVKMGLAIKPGPRGADEEMVKERPSRAAPKEPDPPKKEEEKKPEKK